MEKTLEISKDKHTIIVLWDEDKETTYICDLTINKIKQADTNDALSCICDLFEDGDNYYLYYLDELLGKALMDEVINRQNDRLTDVYYNLLIGNVWHK